MLPVDLNVDIESTAEILEDLFYNIHRFRRLDITIGYRFLRYLRGFRRPLNAVSLTALTISDLTWEADYTILKTHISAPVLRSIIMRGPGFAMPILKFNFGNIRTLVVDEGVVLSMYTHFVDDLRLCTSLEELELTCCSPVLPLGTPSGGPLTFPNLKTFRVIMDSERDPEAFLSSLRFPNLHTLEIRGYTAHFFSALLHADHLAPLLLPSNPPLVSLTLGYFAVTTKDVYSGVLDSSPINKHRMTDLLRGLTSLDSLTIREGRIDVEILNFLTPSLNPAGEIICPALTKLILIHVHFSWDPIIRMLDARVPRENSPDSSRKLVTFMAEDCHPGIPMEDHHKQSVNKICIESGQTFRWAYSISPIN